MLFMLSAIEETARWTTAKIGAVRELAEHTAAYVKGRLHKIYSRELVDVIFEQPYCRIVNLVELDLGRDKLFVHPKLMQVLEKDLNDFDPYASRVPAGSACRGRPVA